MSAVKRAKPARATAEKTTQKETPKQRVLEELARARAAVHEAVGGLTAEEAEEPLAPEKWTVRETVLHLMVRDRVRLDEWTTALSGTSVSWQFLDDEQMSRMNQKHLEPLRDVPWEEALGRLDATRAALLQRIRAVPDRPAEIWGATHAFAWMLDALPRHDRHHAAAIRRWRAARSDRSSPRRSP